MHLCGTTLWLRRSALQRYYPAPDAYTFICPLLSSLKQFRHECSRPLRFVRLHSLTRTRVTDQFGVKMASITEATLCDSAAGTSGSAAFMFAHQETGQDMRAALAAGLVRKRSLSAPEMLTTRQPGDNDEAYTSAKAACMHDIVPNT